MSGRWPLVALGPTQEERTADRLCRTLPPWLSSNSSPQNPSATPPGTCPLLASLLGYHPPLDELGQVTNSVNLGTLFHKMGSLLPALQVVGEIELTRV